MAAKKRDSRACFDVLNAHFFALAGGSFNARM